MNRKRTRRVLFCFSLFSLASVAWAGPNFSGEWKMNPKLSDFGPVPAPRILTRTIKHQDPMLEISTYQKGAQGDSRTELKYTTDGKPCVNKLPGGDATGTAKWDGYRLVIDSTRDFEGKKISDKAIWALSNGGKVLTVLSHVTIPGQGEFNLKYVFDKQ